MKIKNLNGDWVDMTSIKGETGKSAYLLAVEGGYTGTEAEFQTLLNTVPSLNTAMTNIANRVTTLENKRSPVQYGSAAPTTTTCRPGEVYFLI